MNNSINLACPLSYAFVDAGLVLGGLSHVYPAVKSSSWTGSCYIPTIKGYPFQQLTEYQLMTSASSNLTEFLNTQRLGNINVVGIPLSKENLAYKDLQIFQGFAQLEPLLDLQSVSLLQQNNWRTQTSQLISGVYILLTLQGEYFLFNSLGAYFSGNINGSSGNFNIQQNYTNYSIKGNALILNSGNIEASLPQMPVLLFLQYAPNGKLIFGEAPAMPMPKARPVINTGGRL